MDRAELTLVGTGGPAGAGRPARALPLGLAITLLLAAGTSLRVDVRAARTSIDPRDMARQALQLSLESGNQSPEVQQMLLDLRTSLGRRPLDSGARVVYAALLLNLARQLQDSDAAAHHALRAADLAPVTVPIIRMAVLTLIRTDDADAALARVRNMFAYDPRAAAGLLAEIEPLMDPALIPEGVPEDPAAWFAWAAQLRRSRRLDEAFAWNVRTHERWPQHLPSLRFVAARAVDGENWDALERMLPEDAELGTGPEASPVLIYRARLKTARGDSEGAIADIRRGLAVGRNSNLTRILAGEAFEALGEYKSARRYWNLAIIDIPDGEIASRRNLLTRLARLEDNHGRASAALRLWESILEIEPTHAEARQRARALGGYDPLQ